MIWGPDHRYGEVYNFQVQMYKGEPYLTFWAGDDSVGGHGEGKYYMVSTCLRNPGRSFRVRLTSAQLDRHYQEHQKISAGQGIRGDLHGFYFTDDNTAVYTAYEVVQADLTSVGRPGESWIWESLFQELDIETGEVIFEWRASEHFPFADAHSNVNKAQRNSPWDFFHINMVEKDKYGNFLVSTRYGRCALYVAGKDHENPGTILWQLGGKHNSFEDLSGGDATTFVGQHDIHWLNDEEGNHKAITMFDNRGDWFFKIEDRSRGHRIEVDLDNMTANLTQSYVHPADILSTSQGSMQVLPNGNVLLGYGFNGVMTEFSPAGEALCDAYFEPQKGFGSGNVQSYRNMKFNWTGIPLTTPNVSYEDATFYVSWLGSTKVRSWLLQDADAADGAFASVQTAPKRGFETEIHLPEMKPMRRYVRAIAMDAGGTQLSISPPVDLIDPADVWGDAAAADGHDHAHAPMEPDHDDWDYAEDVPDSSLLLVLGVFAAISALLVAWLAFGRRSLPAGILHTEKRPAFRDAESLVGRARAWLPGAKRSWRDGGGAHRSLVREEHGGAGDSFDLEDTSDDERIAR